MVVAGGSVCCQSVSVRSINGQFVDLHPKVFNVGLEMFTQHFHRWIGLKMFGLGLVNLWFGISMGNLDNWYYTTGTTLLVLSLKSAVTPVYRYALGP